MLAGRGNPVCVCVDTTFLIAPSISDGNILSSGHFSMVTASTLVLTATHSSSVSISTISAGGNDPIRYWTVNKSGQHLGTMR